MTQAEVQERFEKYRNERNALICNKFSDNKKFCALDDIAPEFCVEIMQICCEVYDEVYQKVINEICNTVKE